MNFKKRVKRLFFLAISLFVVLFLFRLAYGFYKYPRGGEFQNAEPLISRWHSTSRFLNIASNKYNYKKSSSGSPARSQIVQVDQKFEKTANLQCRSKNFEADEKEIRQTIQAKNTIIQFQQESGNKGNRELHLQIGVPPQVFDPFVKALKDSQNVTAISITKKDKTNEYRELNARIQTLSNTRKSLVAVKEKSGKIEEYIRLEERILSIDEELQELGVQLGNFDAENEFCTVYISLIEGKVRTISSIQRIKVSLEWTIKYYLMLMTALLFALGAVYILVLIIDKLQLVDRLKQLFTNRD